LYLVIALAVLVGVAACGPKPTAGPPTAAEPTSAKAYGIPEETGDGWETASLVEVGVDSGRIADLIGGIRSGEYENVHGIVLVKNGKLVLEEYFDGYDRDRKHYVASVTKSIASVLIGIAMDQGFIGGIAQGGLDTPVVDLFPEYETAISADRAKQDLLLRHILSMSAGLEWDEQTYSYDDPRNDCDRAEHSDDSVGFVLQKPVVATPGTEFLYNGGLSILLSALIQNSTGMHTAEFAREYLFRPLGIEDSAWDNFADGLADTTGGLHMRPRDMAKIGYLMLSGGEWQVSQIVSPEWVNESTRVQIATGLGPDYGYQWWRGKLLVNGSGVETFFASGHGGQKIFVFPVPNLVVVFTQKVFDNPLAEPRNMAMLTRYMLPAALPPTSPREILELAPEDLDRFVGEYESKADEDTLTFFRQRNTLYLRGRDIGDVELFPEAENRFVGTVMDIVDFQIVFEQEHGEAEYLTLHIDFRSGRYDKVK